MIDTFVATSIYQFRCLFGSRFFYTQMVSPETRKNKKFGITSFFFARLIGLKIIHHRSNDVYWNGGDGRTSLWGLQNTRAATNSDEDDDLDLNQNSRSKLERSPFSVLNRASSANKSNQRQIKVYLKNTTVYTGDLVRLHCPYAHPEVSGASHPEEYFSTKTVNFNKFS